MRYLSLFFLFLTVQSLAQSARYDSLWNDPAIKARIQQGIETHRKGEFTLTLTDKQGKPIRNATVEIQQVKHAFLFGANIFMLNGFKTPELNRRYEEIFTSLFTVATVPFFWKTLEPEQGKPRFAATSSVVYRRPPPDVVIDFCQKNGITPRGHTLVWDESLYAIPDWLPKDTSKIQPIIDRRIQQIAERYGSSVKNWDVTNELLISRTQIPMPPNYAAKAFLTAKTYFPKDNRLFINENTEFSFGTYRREYTPYYLLVENLKSKGANIGGIGMQFHLFTGFAGHQTIHYGVVAGNALRPKDVFQSLDLMGSFGLPIHISEITIPALPYNQQGLETQARLLRDYYRLWFSHPSVEALVWWNAADGTAVAGEDRWHGGFLNEDLSPKPAYYALNDLINKEWKTTLTTSVADSKPITFRGFYGDYIVKVTVGRKTTEKTFKLVKGQANTLKLDL